MLRKCFNYASDHLLEIGGIALISLIISVIVLVAYTLIRNRSRKRNSNNHHKQHHDELERRITDLNQQFVQLQRNYENKINELRSEISKSPEPKAVEQTQVQPLSKNQQKNLENQQQRENNRPAEPPKPTVVTCPPEDAELTYFYVQGGKLAPDPTMSSTYISFTRDNIRYYSLNPDKIKMAIANHNSELDPFCEKTADSVDPLSATDIKIKECGTLDQNNAPVKKLKITYVK